MYTFTDITPSHKKLWHNFVFKNWQNCEGSGPLKNAYKDHLILTYLFNSVYASQCLDYFLC